MIDERTRIHDVSIDSLFSHNSLSHIHTQFVVLFIFFPFSVCLFLFLFIPLFGVIYTRSGEDNTNSQADLIFRCVLVLYYYCWCCYCCCSCFIQFIPKLCVHCELCFKVVCFSFRFGGFQSVFVLNREQQENNTEENIIISISLSFRFALRFFCCVVYVLFSITHRLNVWCVMWCGVCVCMFICMILCRNTQRNIAE